MVPDLPSTTEVSLDLDAHGVLVVTLDRPDHRNTVTYTVLDELLAAFEFVDGCAAVRAVVLTGAGDTFSYGTDLRSGDGYAAGSGDFKPLRGGTRDVGGELSLRIFACTRPVIAAINGTAVGIGVSMVLPADVRIAARGTTFALPFVRRGILPESCSTWFLPRLVGIATAAHWTLTGRRFDAQEAFDRGLVQELVEPGAALPRALELARSIATDCAPMSVALTRQMLWRGLGVEHPMTANELESRALLALGAAPDSTEGVASFLERRTPRWTGSTDDLPDPFPWWEEPRFGDLP